MLKKLFFAAAMVMALSTPALANQCPSLMVNIDEAVKTSTVDEATKAKVMELYTKGKAKHEAGDHAASEKDLDEAIKLLGI